MLTPGGCSRCRSAAVGTDWSGGRALLALASAPFLVFGLVVCFGWSWAWNVGAVPLFLLLGRGSGFSPVPGELHLAVQRGSEQPEGHTLAGPPSEASRGHALVCLPSPPPAGSCWSWSCALLVVACVVVAVVVLVSCFDWSLGAELRGIAPVPAVGEGLGIFMASVFVTSMQ